MKRIVTAYAEPFDMRKRHWQQYLSVFVRAY